MNQATHYSPPQSFYCEGCRLWLKIEQRTSSVAWQQLCADCATADGVIYEWTRMDGLHTALNVRGEKLATMGRIRSIPALGGASNLRSAE